SGRRLAVLVNDFGRLNLDAALLAAESPTQPDSSPSFDPAGQPVGPTRRPEVLELTNGCVCCSLADALGDGLDAVLALDPVPDQIVIEASGVADPAKIAAYGQGWPGVRLDAVVTVVDASDIERLAGDRLVGGTVRRQLRAADLLALSHLDLLPAAARRAVAAWLESAAPGVVRLPLDRGAIEPAALLDVAATTDRPIDTTADDGCVSGHGANRATDGSDHGANRAAGGGEKRAPADDDHADDQIDGGGARYVTRSVTVDGPVDHTRLAAAVARWPPEVVRVKGVVPGRDGERWLVHRVGRRCSIEPAPPVDVPPELVVIVAVAPGLEAPSVADLFDSLGSVT
ncbi:MAG: GTP-binding protein, partial [Actinomycetota bacterium]